MTARLVVREKRPDQGIVVLDGQCTDPAGQMFATADPGSSGADDAAATPECRSIGSKG